MSDAIPVSVLIQDAHGRTVLETKVKHAHAIMHDVPDGLYFVRVRTVNTVVVEKIIIER